MEDNIIKPYKYTFELDQNAVRTPDGKYLVWFNGQPRESNTNCFCFHRVKQLTEEEFYSMLEGTEGITNVTGIDRLSPEDIESLGFEKGGLYRDVYLYKDKIDLSGSGEKYTIGILLRRVVIIFYAPNESSIPAGVNLFRGRIKNKPELEMILKMIGVIK